MIKNSIALLHQLLIFPFGTCFICVILTCCSVSNPAYGEFLMTLQGESGSSIVNFRLTGNGVAAESFSKGISGAVFDISGGFDPFPPSDIGTFEIQSGSATWSNLTTNTSVKVVSLALQDSTFLGEVDRFGVSTIPYKLSIGDVLEWTGTGTIDLSERGYVFDDLVLGTAIGHFSLPNIPSVLNGRLLIVPEPSTLMLQSLLLVFSAWRRNSSHLRRHCD